MNKSIRVVAVVSDNPIDVIVLEDVPKKSSEVVEHDCSESDYVKFLLDEKDMKILELEKMLIAERKASQKKVDDACAAARSHMEGMVTKFVGLLPTMVAKVTAQLQVATHTTYHNTIQEIRGSEFFMSTIQEIDNIQSDIPEL